ncbi:MAG: 30S ribosomal protein S5 [Candidatus Micrarchaeales archaeon]|jgi:small subunit ribosomal protein S5|uniref:Small ribosomal subunit protein uS5 n=1 Tax=Candidatus Micrarchaeum acidiphilum ARMAN-2 TaxID=425595 RepID=C7DIU7_MICA2|nr:MAG: ribosomal protein S5 [Candidatus Micrarchaeum acidiphilum ARMAN-2]MCW6161305.1 30S ribosomal protein S5 [Candidatus Micrarchaeales archaeon]
MPRPQRRSYEPVNRFDINAWTPATELGRMVKNHEVTSIEQIFAMSRRIEEVEIVDALLPNIRSEVIDIASVQRMTRNNRKQKFRVVVVAGDEKGHVGIGAAKDIEVKAAIEGAVKNAKRNIIPVMFGCGSWQCTCGQEHSLPFTVKGRCSSIEVILKPAPRGLGIVASKPVKLMLELAGLKDVWSFSRGRTRTKYNTLMAVYNALGNIISMKNVSSAIVSKN